MHAIKHTVSAFVHLNQKPRNVIVKKMTIPMFAFIANGTGLIALINSTSLKKQRQKQKLIFDFVTAMCASRHTSSPH